MFTAKQRCLHTSMVANVALSKFDKNAEKLVRNLNIVKGRLPRPLTLSEKVDHWLTFSLSPLTCSGPEYEKALLYLDGVLQPTSFLVGQKATIGDYAVFGALAPCPVSLWKLTAPDDAALPAHLARWYNMMAARSEVTAALATVPQEVRVAKERKDESAGGKFVELPGAEIRKVVVRFPSEASGFLHVGHVKAALLNNYYKESFEWKLITRFDDTNPAKEKEEYAEVILADLKRLQVRYDHFSRTCDHFDTMDYCDKLIKIGKAYVDDTDEETMKIEREAKQESKHRNNSVDKNMKMWEEMKKGSEVGLKCTVRAKMDMQSLNGCVTDPTIYCCQIEEHPSTGTKYKVYPTYGFACPIVDTVEGVTHALRTTEYMDRDDQFKWFIDALGIRKPDIWTYAHLNLTNTVMSKSKLTWLVDEGIVDDWDFPRLPTVRGILRRGLTLEALQQFIIAQGSSRSVVFMEWDKIWCDSIWGFNKKVIYPIVPRHTNVDKVYNVPVRIFGAKLSSNKSPCHPKNPDVGEKTIWTGPEIIIDEVDSEALKEGENATFIRGNLMIKKVNKEGGKVTSVDATDNTENKDFKKALAIGSGIDVPLQASDVPDPPLVCVEVNPGPDCIICFEESLFPAILSCGHSGCWACICGAMEYSQRCPYCYAVPEDFALPIDNDHEYPSDWSMYPRRPIGKLTFTAFMNLLQPNELDLDSPVRNPPGPTPMITTPSPPHVQLWNRTPSPLPTPPPGRNRTPSPLPTPPPGLNRTPSPGSSQPLRRVRHAPVRLQDYDTDGGTSQRDRGRNGRSRGTRGRGVVIEDNPVRDVTVPVRDGTGGRNMRPRGRGRGAVIEDNPVRDVTVPVRDGTGGRNMRPRGRGRGVVIEDNPVRDVTVPVRDGTGGRNMRPRGRGRGVVIGDIPVQVTSGSSTRARGSGSRGRGSGSSRRGNEMSVEDGEQLLDEIMAEVQERRDDASIDDFGDHNETLLSTPEDSSQQTFNGDHNENLLGTSEDSSQQTFTICSIIQGTSVSHQGAVIEALRNWLVEFPHETSTSVRVVKLLKKVRQLHPTAFPGPRNARQNALYGESITRAITRIKKQRKQNKNILRAASGISAPRRTELEGFVDEILQMDQEREMAAATAAEPPVPPMAANMRLTAAERNGASRTNLERSRGAEFLRTQAMQPGPSRRRNETNSVSSFIQQLPGISEARLQMDASREERREDRYVERRIQDEARIMREDRRSLEHLAVMKSLFEKPSTTPNNQASSNNLNIFVKVERDNASSSQNFYKQVIVVNFYNLKESLSNLCEKNVANIDGIVMVKSSDNSPDERFMIDISLLEADAKYLLKCVARSSNSNNFFIKMFKK